MSNLTVETFSRLFSLLSLEDQNKSLQKVLSEMSFDRQQEILGNCFGDQEVIIIVEGGVADVAQSPVNITVAIDDKD